MSALQEIRDRLGIARELLSFLWAQKLWWLAPLVIVLMLLGLIIGFGTATGVGPFIYTLF